MKPKNFFKGITTTFLTGLLAYSLNTGDVKAQSNPTMVDSTIFKQIIFNFHVYDRATGQGLDGVGINPKSINTNEHLGIYYDIQEPISTTGDGFGNYKMPITMPVKDRITTDIGDYFGFGDKTVPDKFFVGGYPNPFNPETNVVFEAIKSGKYTYQLVDADGSLIASKSVDLSKGNYSMKVNTGAAGVDFMRIIGPDGTVSSVKLVNLGGGYAPFVGEIKSYRGNLTQQTEQNTVSNRSSMPKSGNSSEVTYYGEAVDTVAASFGKTGYPADLVSGIPMHGVELLDTAVVFTDDVTYYQNIFKPGVVNILVDTVETYNNKLEMVVDSYWDNPVLMGKTLVYNQPGGYSADSLDFTFYLSPSGSSNTLSVPNMPLNLDNKDLEKKLKSIKKRYDNIQK